MFFSWGTTGRFCLSLSPSTTLFPSNGAIFSRLSCDVLSVASGVYQWHAITSLINTRCTLLVCFVFLLLFGIVKISPYSGSKRGWKWKCIAVLSSRNIPTIPSKAEDMTFCFIEITLVVVYWMCIFFCSYKSIDKSNKLYFCTYATKYRINEVFLFFWSWIVYHMLHNVCFSHFLTWNAIELWNVFIISSHFYLR